MAGLDDGDRGMRACGIVLLVLALVVWVYGFWWVSALLKR